MHARIEALERRASESHAQIDLFAAAPAEVLSADAGPSRLEQALAGIDPDALSPKDALDALYRLKAVART